MLILNKAHPRPDKWFSLFDPQSLELCQTKVRSYLSVALLSFFEVSHSFIELSRVLVSIELHVGMFVDLRLLLVAVVS